MFTQMPFGSVLTEFNQNKETTPNEIKIIQEQLKNIQNEEASIKETLDQVCSNQTKILAILMKVSEQKIIETHQLCPILTSEDLKNLDTLAYNQQENIVENIKLILIPGGLQKNFDRIFGSDIINAYNYDGVNNKQPLKEFKSLMNAIWEALKEDGFNEKLFIKTMKESLKIHKNRFFKRQYDLKKKKMLTVTQ